MTDLRSLAQRAGLSIRDLGYLLRLPDYVTCRYLEGAPIPVVRQAGIDDLEQYVLALESLGITEPHTMRFMIFEGADDQAATIRRSMPLPAAVTTKAR